MFTTHRSTVVCFTFLWGMLGITIGSFLVCAIWFSSRIKSVEERTPTVIYEQVVHDPTINKDDK